MDEQRLEQSHVRLVQVIYLTLMAGVIAFASVSLVLRTLGGGTSPTPAPMQGQGIDVILVAALCVFVATGVMSMVIPRTIEAATRREWEGREQDEAAAAMLLLRWRTQMILRGALLEGAALLGIAVYFLGGSGIGLAIGGVNLVLMAMGFPSRAGLAAFTERILGRR